MADLAQRPTAAELRSLGGLALAAADRHSGTRCAPPGARRSPTPSSAARSARSPAAWPRWASAPATTSRSSAATRPEWTLADFGAFCAGATVVPVYHTNSPEECEYVLAHAGVEGASFCEDAAQAAKIAQVRERCPSSST